MELFGMPIVQVYLYALIIARSCYNFICIFQ